MRHAATQALYAYWNDVRRSRVAPERLEIQPTRIGEGLRDTFILERVDPVTYRFRLAGTRVSQRFGMDLKSLNFLDHWSPADRGLLEHHLAAITERGRGGVFTVRGQLRGLPSRSETCSDTASESVMLEILVLPLVHTGGSMDRLLCALVPLEEPTFDTRPAILTSLKLLAAEVIWPDGEPRDGWQPQDEEGLLADGPQAMDPHVRLARIVRQGRRQFRVYDGGLAGHSND